MRCFARIAAYLLLSSTCLAGGPAVNESARQIPVAYKVDVVVVGGSTGAVAAAVSAAEAGAKVFLAAPRPYLGDDMTATLRLWLEKGEKPIAPLAKLLFTDTQTNQALPDPNRIPFSYEDDQPDAAIHKDTKPPSLLTDGKWLSASQQSVQYDGDVTITADLGKTQPVESVRVMAFRRPANDKLAGFVVDGITVLVSDDKKDWQPAGVLKADDPSAASVLFSAPVRTKARYVKFLVKKTSDVSRLLLGEIEIIRPASGARVVEAGRCPPPRPMHIKKTLDEALLAAGVEFLYSCYPTDILRDSAGNPCGIVMANRAGRQAVVAKTIIDATDRALVARLAGARFRPFPVGIQTLKGVVIGGEPRTAPNMTARTVDPPFLGRFPNQAKTASGEFQIIEYTLDLPIKGDDPDSWAGADQKFRSLTYHPEQQFVCDQLFQIPPDPMHGRQAAAGNESSLDELPLGAFQSAEATHLYVLGGCADISREQAARLMRPIGLIDAGIRIGKAAAKEAKSLPTPKGAALVGKETAKPAAAGDVGEILLGVRPIQELPTIDQPARALPVLGSYDVVVIGGGTGGAPAGIGAARRGSKTLVVEYLHGLGGVGTIGAISKYYWGNRVGFCATVEGGPSWVIEHKKQWYRDELLKAGADIWFGSIGCGALVNDGRVCGAVVATPQGRGVVLAKVVIDATGNSDVAVAAGAACLYTDQTEFGMQGTGLPPRELGATYTNTDFTVVDETDMLDVWRMFVFAKQKYPNAFDQGRLIDTRERRRIVGDFTMSILDQVNLRTYPDTVVWARSNFDTHGFTVDPYFMLEHPEKKGIYVNIPYRCMLPKGLEGILVIGLGTSVTRDAVPLVRMQPDIQNQGYASGVAAAMAAKVGSDLRNIDIRALQKHLIEMGNLQESVLTDEDSHPMPREKIVEAVKNIKDHFKGSAVVLAHPQQALPLLKEAYATADNDADKLTYAKVLATMGEAAGLEPLLAEVSNVPQWDKGWNYRGMGQFGNAFSPLDSLVVALGRPGDSRAVPVILKKLELLTAESEFSHHRSAALALELIGDPAAAPALAKLLGQPDMTGYVHDSIEVVVQRGVPGGTCSEETRRDSLRELVLARALYRCGDHKGLGEKILRNYTKDLRGHLARHATAVLKAK